MEVTEFGFSTAARKKPRSEWKSQNSKWLKGLHRTLTLECFASHLIHRVWDGKRLNFDHWTICRMWVQSDWCAYVASYKHCANGQRRCCLRLSMWREATKSRLRVMLRHTEALWAQALREAEDLEIRTCEPKLSMGAIDHRVPAILLFIRTTIGKMQVGQAPRHKSSTNQSIPFFVSSPNSEECNFFWGSPPKNQRWQWKILHW